LSIEEPDDRVSRLVELNVREQALNVLKTGPYSPLALPTSGNHANISPFTSLHSHRAKEAIGN
jgi:hypothetical protein